MPTIDLIHKGTLLTSKPVIEGTEPTFVPAVQSSVHMGWHSVDYDGKGAGLTKSGDVYSGKPLPPGTYNVRFMGNGGFPKFEEQITYRQVLPAPAQRWNGTISDNGSVTQNVADAKKLGFDTMRIWVKWMRANGTLANPAIIAMCNEYIQNGLNVVICLTPEQGTAPIAYPESALAYIAANLNKKAIVQFINEANWGDYFVNRDYMAAWAMCVKAARYLRPLGFKVFGPSWTWTHAESLDAMIGEVEARGDLKEVDGIDLHCYPTLDCVVGGNPDGTPIYDRSRIAPKLNEFEAICKVGAARAAKNGIAFGMSEYGLYGKTDDDRKLFPEVAPLLMAIAAKYTTAFRVWFLMRYIEKHAKYALHLIDAAGKRTALGTAVAQSTGPIS